MRQLGPARFAGAAVLGASLVLSLAAGPSPVLAAPTGARAITHGEAVSFFILNCAYFGTWEGEKDPTRSNAVRVGILGYDSLGTSLERASRAAKEAWFPDGSILIERSNSPEALAGSHVVFVGSSERDNLASILEVFRRKPVLLVSEIPDFVRQGGMIGIRIRAERLQFDVNLDALEASGVALSSNMKKRATTFVKNGKSVTNELGERGAP